MGLFDILLCGSLKFLFDKVITVLLQILTSMKYFSSSDLVIFLILLGFYMCTMVCESSTAEPTMPESNDFDEPIEYSDPSVDYFDEYEEAQNVRMHQNFMKHEEL